MRICRHCPPPAQVHRRTRILSLRSILGNYFQMTVNVVLWISIGAECDRCLATGHPHRTGLTATESTTVNGHDYHWWTVEYDAWVQRIRHTHDAVRFTVAHRIKNWERAENVAVQVVTAMLSRPRVFRYQGCPMPVASARLRSRYSPTASTTRLPHRTGVRSQSTWSRCLATYGRSWSRHLYMDSPMMRLPLPQAHQPNRCVSGAQRSSCTSLISPARRHQSATAKPDPPAALIPPELELRHAHR